MRKNTRRSTIGTVICLSLALNGYAQVDKPEALTVQETVQKVIAQNLTLKEAEDAIAVIKARVDQLKSGLLPNVRGDASYSRIGPVEELTFPGFGTFQLFPADNYDIHAGVRQLLYDGKRTKESIALAESQVESAVDRWELLKRDMAFQTVQLCDSILFLRESLRVQSDHVKALSDHLDIARKKVAAGTATELEVLNTQVRVVAAQNQVVDLQNMIEKQTLGLQQLMKLEDEAPFELSGEFRYQPMPLDADELIRLARLQRPETRSIQNLMKSANIEVLLASLTHLPVISANVLFGAKNGYIPNLNTVKLNFVAAVSASVSVFDGHLGRAQKMQATANLKTFEDRNQELEAMIKTEVRQAISDVRASDQKLKAVEVNIEQAKKAMAYAQARYEAGTITNLDLLDTEDALTEAEFAKLRALYQFVLSKLTLQRAVGNPLVGK
ncbi:MAG: TolC family protein [Candidatus Aminicenantales bacterium]